MKNMPEKFVVCALYRFVRLDDYRELRLPLLDLMQHHGVRGTLLLAPEGINGTLAGSRDGVDGVLAWLKSDPRLAGLSRHESLDDECPFYRAKVKLKREIVTLGMSGIDPRRMAGTYVEPEDWNELISDPDVTVIDTRNRYEVDIGTFSNAVNPGTDSFREFPEYVRRQLDPARHKKIAMFCTGGIRCEKSTAFLKEQGFDEVYHLKGGILKYLETIPPEESLWEGECFVFDNRVSVRHGLRKGEYDQCHACRMPITEAEKQSAKYEKGVSCPKCFDAKNDEQRRRYRERIRQVHLARQRGEPHIGGEVSDVITRRKSMKRQLC